MTLMTPEDALREIIRPTLAELGKHDRTFDTDQTAVGLLAVALQESGLEHRRQLVKCPDGKLTPVGPARGLWQFESAGVHQAGLKGPACCREMVYSLDPCALPIKGGGRLRGEWKPLHLALELACNDRIACLLAAALPRSLGLNWPKIGDEAACWLVYLKAWRPGAPHRERWTRSYARARAAVEAGRKDLRPAAVRV
jgi:hypothetical protein